MPEREVLFKKYEEMRDAYLKTGVLLNENVVLFMKIMQNMEEIREELKKGWGYKK